MTQSTSGARLTGWVSLAGAVFAALTVILSTIATNDIAVQLDGSAMLALPQEARDLFRWSMICDVLGFYLPFLVVGAYYWNAHRESAGSVGDMAAFAIVTHVVVGAAGAAMQLAAVQPLARLYAGGDDTVRAAAEAAWTGLAHASQKGLWWIEGPLVFCWALVVGDQIKSTARWRALLLKTIGLGYGFSFVLSLFLESGDVTDWLEYVVVVLTPIWMAWSGWALLRGGRTN